MGVLKISALGLAMLLAGCASVQEDVDLRSEDLPLWNCLPQQEEKPARRSVSLLVAAANDEAAIPAARIHTLVREQLENWTQVPIENQQFLPQYQDPTDPAADPRLKTCIEEARSSFDKGVNLYENLEIEPAMSELSRATKILNSCLPGLVVTGKTGPYMDVVTFLAACHLLVGADAIAQGFLERLIPFGLEAFADTRYFPPSMRAWFEKVFQAQAPSGGTAGTGGALLALPAPVGAEVWIDGVLRGVSPLKLGISAGGWHFVAFVRRGYRAAGQWVKLEGGESEVLEQTLEPVPGISRYLELEAQLARMQRLVEFAEVGDQMARWLGVQRVLLFQVQGGKAEILLRSCSYDAEGRRCTRSQDARLPTEAERFDRDVLALLAGLLRAQD